MKTFIAKIKVYKEETPCIDENCTLTHRRSISAGVEKLHIVKADDETGVKTKLDDFYKKKDTKAFHFKVSVVDIEEEI